MSEQFYICRVRLDRTANENRFSYLSKGYGWCNRFDDALPFVSRETALTQLQGRPGSIWPESELKASPYYLAEIKITSKTTMSTALQKNPATGHFPPPAVNEVISAEQGKLIDRAKVYLKAEAVTEQHQRMYLFLIGATLLTLKDCTPHGNFEDAKKIFFPDVVNSRMCRAVTYAEAVTFFAKGKSPTIGDLTKGDRLLAAGELSEKEKEQLVEEMVKTDKGGVMKTIQAWHNKKAPKEKPQEDPLHAHDEHLKNIHALFANFEAAALALLDEGLLPAIDFATEPAAMRDTVSALCVRIGKRVKQAKRDAKTKKAKAS